jgi:thiamine biosynthesis lipoprotein
VNSAGAGFHPGNEITRRHDRHHARNLGEHSLLAVDITLKATIRSLAHTLLPPILATLVVGLWPARAAEAPVRYEASNQAMGTIYTVVAYGPDRTFLSEVVNEVFARIDQLDEQMSNYKPGSELSAINRDAAEREVTVSPQLFGLIQYSLRASQESGGDFDITVGPLMKLWGFFRGQGRLPSAPEIAQVQKRIGYQHVHLDAARRTIRFDSSGMELDLGGIAKGYAVDQAAEIMRSNGVTAALISSGTSSIYALGSPPGERGWKITVRDPFHAEKPADIFHLQNFALSTSGNYEKFFKINGKIYCHIMDPHTGWPVQGMLSTVAAVPTGIETEALTKIFFVGGVEKSRQYLAAHPNAIGIFYQPGDKPQTFRRTVLRSKSFQIPSGSIAELEK